jgi:hypothetical protein
VEELHSFLFELEKSVVVQVVEVKGKKKKLSKKLIGLRFNM